MLFWLIYSFASEYTRLQLHSKAVAGVCQDICAVKREGGKRVPDFVGEVLCILVKSLY